MVKNRVVIFHDYAGICYHATGFWERREESSKNYYMKMNELMRSGVEVIFVKVDSHTGDLFNELVDEKCKEKLGIDSDKTVAKWLDKNIIQVANEEVKEEIIKIAPGREVNIVVVKDKGSVLNVINTETKCNNKSVENIVDKEEVIRNINDILFKLSVEDQLKVLNYSKTLGL